ncbi:unnamed protein product [Chilo suppressalis]|uniref:Uncharacterized protein n=1 Tax=Chilo suppressalis TaxID=168631 RepID=A0ABN8AZ12_CHISP|nr:unnamed protein product [Chilo suppressalis]
MLAKLLLLFVLLALASAAPQYYSGYGYGNYGYPSYYGYSGYSPLSYSSSYGTYGASPYGYGYY